MTRTASRLVIATAAIVATWLFAANLPAQNSILPPINPREPGWEGRVLLFGEERDRIKSMPIEVRPNRTGHFYGNTVRRIYYRGFAIPLPRDFVNMTYAFVRDR